MRSKEEILQLIQELENAIEYVRNNQDNWRDPNVPIDLIREKLTRIHTLEWVLGEHDRYD